MKRILALILIVLMALYALPACAKESGWSEEDRRLSQISEALDVDLRTGTLVRFEDTHGGFHGDGHTTAEVELDGVAVGLADVPGWKPLPMSENAAEAVRVCGGESASAEQGWYYLYDRHSESKDPYDDSELHSRYSWNFTAAVYDSRSGRLYFYQLDT